MEKLTLHDAQTATLPHSFQEDYAYSEICAGHGDFVLCPGRVRFLRSLVVEDAPIIRLVLARILKKFGVCESVQNGEQALDVYYRSLKEDHPFELICLDLGLPGIQGSDVLRKIREFESQDGFPARSRARILVITASSEMTDVKAVKQLGADGYLVKPIVKETLVQYLTACGFSGVAAAQSYESVTKQIEAMCELDKIPSSVLTTLMQSMARSLGRQASEFGAQAESSPTREN